MWKIMVQTDLPNFKQVKIMVTGKLYNLETFGNEFLDNDLFFGTFSLRWRPNCFVSFLGLNCVILDQNLYKIPIKKKILNDRRYGQNILCSHIKFYE